MSTIRRAALLAASALTLSALAAPAATAAPAVPAAAVSSASSLAALHGSALGPSTIPFTAAQVTDHGDGTFTLTWSAPRGTRVTVYTGASRDAIDLRHAVAHGEATGSVTLRGLGDADRRWFRFEPSRGDGLTLADRLVRLDGTANLRDVGGYRTADGHWVEMGEMYRSDALDRLTDADLTVLEGLDVRTVMDLRTDDEVAAAPDRVPAGARDVHLDVLGTTASFAPTSATDSERLMVEAERTMVSSDAARAAYTTVLDHADDRGAILFHCTAGKDRTGWASATILTALGVPRETVEADYLASNDYRAQANAAVLAQLPAAQAEIYRPLLDVRSQYLAAGFDEVHQRYGTFGRYLFSGVHVGLLEQLSLRHDLLVG
ncbi:tyrosine-protein phosphatase [Cellulomonas sp. PhB143]|uniref:tyrosine-protein phosphatase n=1 Tax=Cellulomonas sp. PhB143 TaxID=2485186 RepID=UPI000F462B3E|nr:tyrosine-protein phosphatase [Cellulomonas sp. PhB143]ROS76478.1 protein-tyrosine phosphatase [Cellulomonas sp. PhB143]